MHLPAGTYVDAERGFAIIVPRGWEIVDQKKVTVDRSVQTAWRLVATLISSAGGVAPTVTVNAMDTVWNLPVDAIGIAEIERWLRATWGQQAEIELSTDITTVDGMPSFHSSILATVPEGRRVSLDQYVFSGANRSYAIVAALDGGGRAETASAAQAVAEGFRVLDRPKAELHARRIAEEVCAAAGRPSVENAQRLLAGDPIAVNGLLVRLICEKSDPEHIYAYVDFGLPSSPGALYEQMLKINFNMAAGKLGVLSLHGTTSHVLYAYRYPLAETSRGEELLGRLLRVIDDLGEELFPDGVRARSH